MPNLLVPEVHQLPVGTVHVELPTPFPVGPVNCYVLTGSPVTVIDPGMLFGDSVATLTSAIKRAGLELSDVEVVVVTHGHPDHFGAAGWLAEQSGAAIVTGRAELPKLLETRDRDQLYQLIRTFGIPEDDLAAFPVFYAAVKEWIHDIDPENVTPVDDGELLELGGRIFDAIVTPGHAAGHLSLWDPADSVLFSGDHILPSITPNPLVELDEDSDLLRRRSLVEYLASLDRFVALHPSVVLPGHGPAFSDVSALVERTRAHHARRADDLARHVAVLGEPTAYELSRAMFPHIDGFEVMLSISEVLGHIDLLIERGAITQSGEEPIRYAAA
jgi:glyoxylase-like metal-dependent hydrolase (beta-lactamase superfamily II)